MVTEVRTFYFEAEQVDKLDNSVDFARAYGALGWALSKVIKRKAGGMQESLSSAGVGDFASPGHSGDLYDVQ